jgi:hypothetical protein
MILFLVIEIEGVMTIIPQSPMQLLGKMLATAIYARVNDEYAKLPTALGSRFGVFS